MVIKQVGLTRNAWRKTNIKAQRNKYFTYNIIFLLQPNQSGMEGPPTVHHFHILLTKKPGAKSNLHTTYIPETNSASQILDPLYDIILIQNLIVISRLQDVPPDDVQCKSAYSTQRPLLGPTEVTQRSRRAARHVVPGGDAQTGYDVCPQTPPGDDQHTGHLLGLIICVVR